MMISTRDFVLYMLKSADGFVSGEEISESIGVSRAAINTAVKALRSDGYEIESVTNRGYKLCGSKECLCLGEIMKYIGQERAETVTVLDSVDSTNNYLKKLCSEKHGDFGRCVIADYQSGGKGRLGRSFSSEKNVGVYLSYAINPQKATPSEISEITAWGAVAVCRAIEEVCGISCGIKWVNDIIYENMKICGILTELSVEAESGNIQSVVIGIGINTNNEKSDFPKEIQDIAASLKMICKHEVSRAELCASVIKNLDKLCEEFPQKREEYLCEYREKCSIIGRDITVINGDKMRKGKALGIDDNFGLRVRYENGEEKTIIGGEVSVKGIYGAK